MEHLFLLPPQKFFSFVCKKAAWHRKEVEWNLQMMGNWKVSILNIRIGTALVTQHRCEFYKLSTLYLIREWHSCFGSVAIERKSKWSSTRKNRYFLEQMIVWRLENSFLTYFCTLTLQCNTFYRVAKSAKS